MKKNSTNEIETKYNYLYHLVKRHNSVPLKTVKLTYKGITAILDDLVKYNIIPKYNNNKNDKLVTNKTDDYNISFTAHITHGSSNYDKWWKNPEIVVAFFNFIARCDEKIYNYLVLKYGESSFSREISFQPKEEG